MSNDYVVGIQARMGSVYAMDVMRKSCTHDELYRVIWRILQEYKADEAKVTVMTHQQYLDRYGGP